MKLLTILLTLAFTSYSYAAPKQAKKTYEFDLEAVKYIIVGNGIPKLSLKYKKGIQKASFSVRSLGETKGKAQGVINVSSEYQGDTYVIKNNLGNYSCSVTEKNGKVTKVKGACLKASVLTLPKGAKVEVYNNDKLISKVFFPMSVEKLLERLDEPFVDKLKAIDAFLKTYKKTKAKLEISSETLGKIIDEFTWDDKKLKALKKLHKSVTDRENLEALITDKFSHFEQDKARKVVGLPKKN